MILLDGVAIAGYRSFPTQRLARFSPLSDVNFIAGQNNSGKSNLLRFLHGVLAQADASGDTVVVSDWDRPLGESEHRYRLAIAFSLEKLRVPSNESDAAHELLELLGVLKEPEPGHYWFEYSLNGLGRVSSRTGLDEAFLADLARRAPQRAHRIGNHLSRVLTNTSGGSAGDDIIRALQRLAPDLNTLPPARTITGVRQLESIDESTSSLIGRNLIRKLRALHSPALAQLHDREKFDAIVEFARAVLEDDTVGIDIPHDLSSVLVTRGGETLPIENLGTGVHEVLILAAAATTLDSSVVCIEEPEVHLHPLLQRKLIRYLRDKTSNQYFVATHSAHMLDSEVGSVFHVQMSENRSSVTFAGSPRERAAITADLGYHPSDLVQANAVVWVEGPSDRIYVRHWLKLLAPQFVEGLHYSIMFYGGRLLAHLSPDDPEVGEFISLRRLNRHVAIVIDSDRTTPHARLNATKRRVRERIAEDGPGFAWITQGYTIENYVPNDLLERAIDDGGTRPPSGQFENPLAEARLGHLADKVKIARRVVERWDDETGWPLDLKGKIGDLVRLIRFANAS